MQADYLVVGGGLTGTAVAWRLAELAQSVILVDRDVPASAHGSSHGSARIFRYPYPDPLYTQLVVDAAAMWEDLEKSSGRRLITPSGAVDHGSLRDPVHLARVLSDAGVDHTLLTPAEAAARWPHMNFDTDAAGNRPVLWHPGAGVIDAEATVHAQAAQARRNGAVVMDHWEVSSVRRRGGLQKGYTVTSTTGDVLEAGHVVVCVGGWVNDLLARTDLPGRFRARLPRARVSQEYAYHFPYRDDTDRGATPDRASTSWPTTIHLRPEMQVYTLPGGRDAGHRGQKVAEFNAGRAMSSASLQDGRIDPANRARVVEYVRQYLPGLVPEPFAETTCLFTTLPDDDFLVDTAEGVTVVSPCSGHGAKFAPLIGSMAAQLALGRAGVPDRFRARA
jgi:sarcosine oxidase